MSQVQIFEIEIEEDSEEWHPKRPKYFTIIDEEDYESDDEPIGWDFQQDVFFPLQ